MTTQNPTPLRALIRSKLADGRLPVNSIPRVWGGAGNGETCDACEEAITKDQFVLEGLSVAEPNRGIQLHAECFYFWDRLRRM
jgi:hypothetical protein